MSQGQPRRPQYVQQEPVKYGDVFQVSGDVAEKPIAPAEAAVMRNAEAAAFGQPQRDGPAAVMEAAAAVNERAGLVRPGEVTDVAGDISVTDKEYAGTRIVTESVAGQVISQYYESTQVPQPVQSQITIGEALEAAALAAADEPVDQGDAAAIQAAEARATGTDVITPGGVASAAKLAASFNAGLDSDEDKIKLAGVLTGPTTKLPGDMAATREDAEGVTGAETRSSPNLTTYPGGVAASVATAARLNEGTA
ncbi:hypothetical protein NMG60_11029915 [Bertholletia excelsa]